MRRKEEKRENFPVLDVNEVPKYALNGGKREKTAEENAVWKGVVCLLFSAFCFSLMSLFVRLSGDVPTFQKAFFRNIVAAVAAFLLLVKSKNFKMQKGSFPALLARSITGCVGIVCNFYAIDRMNISDASILNKLAPFFSVVFSILVLKEKAGWKDWLIVTVAFVGAVFVVKPSPQIAQSAPALIGVLGGLGAGLAYTFVRYLGMRGERTTFIVFFFSVFSSLVVLPVMIVQFQPMAWWQVGYLLLAGCAATGAQFSITAAYKFAPAKEISVYDYSQVLFTALLGAIFLAEFPDYLSVIGYSIIIGAAIVKWLLSKKKRK